MREILGRKEDPRVNGYGEREARQWRVDGIGGGEGA